MVLLVLVILTILLSVIVSRSNVGNDFGVNGATDNHWSRVV